MAGEYCPEGFSFPTACKPGHHCAVDFMNDTSGKCDSATIVTRTPRCPIQWMLMLQVSFGAVSGLVLCTVDEHLANTALDKLVLLDLVLMQVFASIVIFSSLNNYYGI